MMQKLLVAAFAIGLSFCATEALAQTPNGFVGVGTTTPKAKLDIASDTSGLLLPRYATKAAADAVLTKLNSTDHKGLMIFVAEAANQGFWYYDGTAWVKSGGSPFFKVSSTDANHIIYTSSTNYGKNFVVNADSTNYDGSGLDAKMFFVSGKGAFRAGVEGSTAWNAANIGNYSTAFGKDAKASGESSTAMGVNTTASAYFSTAMGKGTTASGEISTAMGDGTNATGYNSTVMGRNSTASAQGAIAIGEASSASGNFSIAMGQNDTASAGNSIAMGTETKATQTFATAMGKGTIASGSYSTAMGYGTKATQTFATAMGNGTTASGESSTAMGDGSIASGSYSTAMSKGTKASSAFAVAMGNSTTASGESSTAMGNSTTASGNNSIASGQASVAMGQSTTASSQNSVAMGYSTTASAYASTAMGNTTKAKSFGETALGSYNDTLAAVNATSFKSDTNRVFTVGNGTSSARNTAFVVQQNGNVGINTRVPSEKLDITGSIKIKDGTEGTGKVLTSDANGKASWQAAAAGGFFKVSSTDANQIIYTSSANYGKNFVVNADSTNYKGTGTESKLFFVPGKSALRAGSINTTKWDAANIGDGSVAFGADTKASGSGSTAMGINTTASGAYSTVMGSANTASGSYSTAMGISSTASGYSSTAMGQSTTASGQASVAMGQSTTASSQNSVAMGYSTTASAYASTAMGQSTTASAYASTAMGNTTKAKSFGETALGSYNDTLAAVNATSFKSDTNRVFTVGNGTGVLALNTAFVVQQNGNVGINTRVPSEKLDITGSIKIKDGTEGTGKVLTSDATGKASWQTAAGGGFFKVSSTDANQIIYTSSANYGKNFVVNADSTNYKGTGTESKLFFIPGKSALRAGSISNTNWDAANIGDKSVALGAETKASAPYSTAMGNSTTASGYSSTAMGNSTTASSNSSTAMGYATTASGDISTAMGTGTTASGSTSTAMGDLTTASGNKSTAMGKSTTASGTNSTAMGFNNIASGYNSTAMGVGTTASGDNSTAMCQGSKAKSYGETAIGVNNDTLASVDVGIFGNDTNRVFTVGNGTSPSARKTAFVVQQNGNVGVGDRKPSSLLDVNGSFSLPIVSKSANYTATISDYTIICKSGLITITLPDATSCVGRIYVVKNMVTPGTGLDAIVVNGTGSTSKFYENGSSTSSSTSSTFGGGSPSTYTFQSDGTDWYVISKF